MSSCIRCTRRSVLLGAGALVLDSCVGRVLETQPPVPTPDGGGSPPVDPGPPDATPPSTFCQTNLCLDLTDAHYAALNQVNGVVMLIAPNFDTLVVVRTTQTACIALSAICTHQGCTVAFDPAAHQMNCPCHGSLFDEAGQVVHGPATLPLQSYTTVLEDGVVKITVV